METRRILCLTKPTTFHQPTSWEIHACYAQQRSGREVQVPAGAWLVELGSIEIWPDQKIEYIYRTPSGEVVALEAPLAEDRYREVTDPQVVTALNVHRSLDTILEEDFGLSLHQTCRGLPPFALIQCPLCSGTSFTTLDLASAWCAHCNAAFHVRPTAGDPGFVVDVTWKHYNPLAAYYVLPKTDRLLSTLVLKDSGDPRDMNRAHCPNECLSGPILLTDGSTGLRPGLHRCQIGTLYGWRRIYGLVPVPEDLREDRFWEIDGLGWPASVAVRVLPLKRTQRQALEQAVKSVQKEGFGGAIQEIQDILEVRSQPPIVLEAVLPDVRNLKEEERYLLHHWVTIPPENPYTGREVALPVWYVVTPVLSDRYLTGWTVVRKDICPYCGDPVFSEGVAAGNTGHSERDLPHGYCREAWAKTGWQPLHASNGAGG